MNGKDFIDPIEANKIVYPRFIKVISLQQTGVGYRYNENLISTSFHLVGSVLPPTYISKEAAWLVLLFAHNYIDENHKLTHKALSIKSCDHIYIDPTRKIIREINTESDHSHSYESLFEDEFEEITFEKLEKWKSEFFDFVQDNLWVKEISLHTSNIQVVESGVVSEYAIPAYNKYQLEIFAYYDIFPILLSSNGKELHPISVLDFYTVPPQIGETVFFGGYPLTQHEYTFSCGMVSTVCINKRDVERSHVVIEASVTPGNSGSPVFLWRDNKPCIIGIISSELAHVSDELYNIRDNLELMAHHPDREKKDTYVSNPFRSADNKVRDIYRPYFNDLSTAYELIKVTFKNLNTGKARVILLDDLREILAFEGVPAIITPFLDFFVSKRDEKCLFQYILDFEGSFTYQVAIKFLQIKGEKIGAKALSTAFTNINIGESSIIFPKHMQSDITPRASKQLPQYYDPNSKHDRGETSKSLVSAYSYCYQVSQGMVTSNIKRYGSSNKLKKSKFMTVDFFTKHFGSDKGNKKSSQANAKIIAKSRQGSTASKSTTLRPNECAKFDTELTDKNKGYYHNNEENAANIAAMRGLSVYSIFYRTNDTYHADTRAIKEPGLIDSKSKDHFIYCVTKVQEGFYANHYQSSASEFRSQLSKPGIEQLDKDGLVFVELKSALDI